MTDEPCEDWTPEERDRLRSLARERMPPAALEDRVVLALQESGWLGARRLGARRWLRAGAAQAAAQACFLLGWAAAPRSSTRGGVPTGGDRYVLFLYEGKQFVQGPSTHQQERIREYGAWARRGGELGTVLGGEKLKDGGRLLLPDGEAVDLPFFGASDSEILAGYFVIQTQSYQRAVALARTCPHLRYGGRIAIRQIETT